MAANCSPAPSRRPIPASSSSSGQLSWPRPSGAPTLPPIAAASWARNRHSTMMPAVWLPKLLTSRDAAIPHPLFDHLIGESEEIGFDGEAERPGGLSVDGQFEHGRLL